MKQTSRTSVELLPGQYEHIQRIALGLGYIQSRGVGAGKVGSMAQLMQAIAKGEVKVIKTETLTLIIDRAYKEAQKEQSPKAP